MNAEASGEVPVTFANGVLDDVGELTATSADDVQADRDDAEALKRRIAELLVECKEKSVHRRVYGARAPS